MRWPIAVRFTLTVVLFGLLYGAGLGGLLLAGAVALAAVEAYVSWLLKNQRDAQRDAIAKWKRAHCQGVVVSHSQR